MVTGALGLDRDAFATYVETERTDYLAAEVWVRGHAKTLTPAAVDALNALIRGTKMPAEMAAKRRAELGSGAAGLEYGVALNDLDDWLGLHRQLKASVPV